MDIEILSISDVTPEVSSLFPYIFTQLIYNFYFVLTIVGRHGPCISPHANEISSIVMASYLGCFSFTLE